MFVFSVYSSVYMHREVAKLSKKYGPVMSISIGKFNKTIDPMITKEKSLYKM